MTYDLAELKDCIGTAETAKDLASARLDAEFRATFGDYLAPTAAGEAPLGFHWCLATPAAPQASLGPDGHALGGGLLPPLPGLRRMWAGSKLSFAAAIPVGAEVTRRTTVEDIAEKEGSASKLLFVTLRQDFEIGGELAVREHQTAVYREPASAGSGGGKPAAAEPKPAAQSWQVEGSPPLLFRYSAMTFNAHRIHYDLPYATEVEGYPGLLVHGPLQATLLLNAAAVFAGKAPKGFSCRGRAPLIAGSRFAVKVEEAENGAEAWTETADGAACMTARATWS